MGNYIRVQAVPKIQLSLQSLTLIYTAEDTENLFNSIFLYFDWARVKDNSKPMPELPELSRKDSFSFDSICGEIDTAVSNFWREAEKNERNRNSKRKGDLSSTSGRPNQSITYSSIDKSNYSSTHSNTPTLEEVEREIKSKGLRIDGKGFFDHFNGNGWRDNKGNPVKNWKALLNSWASEKQVHAQQYEQRDYSEQELADISNDPIIQALEAQSQGKDFSW